MEIIINIAEDFSPNLGLRFKSLGEFSGEEFYEKLLEPKYKEAKEQNEKLRIILDGATPYGSSFVDESFGKLAREYGVTEVDSCVQFVSELYPHVIRLIRKNWGLEIK